MYNESISNFFFPCIQSCTFFTFRDALNLIHFFPHILVDAPVNETEVEWHSKMLPQLCCVSHLHSLTFSCHFKVTTKRINVHEACPSRQTNLVDSRNRFVSSSEASEYELPEYKGNLST